MLGPDKRTPLIEAAGRGELEMVQLLLAAGADRASRWLRRDGAAAGGGQRTPAPVARVLSPLAEDEERELARSFLAASVRPHAPRRCGRRRA